MKIKKNGKVINLTEGDIKKLNKSLLKESPEDLEGRVVMLEKQMKIVTDMIHKMSKDTSGIR